MKSSFKSLNSDTLLWSTNAQWGLQSGKSQHKELGICICRALKQFSVSPLSPDEKGIDSKFGKREEMIRLVSLVFVSIFVKWPAAIHYQTVLLLQKESASSTLASFSLSLCFSHSFSLFFFKIIFKKIFFFFVFAFFPGVSRNYFGPMSNLIMLSENNLHIFRKG